jgi:hypothetical protein
MTVQDDLRRLSQMDSIYLGFSVANMSSVVPLVGWYKGRLQQANDSNWLFRSISADGTISGFQLGPALQSWQSSESPSTGLTVTFPLMFNLQLPGQPAMQISLFGVALAQQLPEELTN